MQTLSANASDASVEDVVDELDEKLWRIGLTQNLGADIGTPDDGRIQRLDINSYSSVTRAVAALNSGEVTCADGMCIVFSATDAKYYLVMRVDKQAEGARVADEFLNVPRAREDVWDPTSYNESQHLLAELESSRVQVSQLEAKCATLTRERDQFKQQLETLSLKLEALETQLGREVVQQHSEEMPKASVQLWDRKVHSEPSPAREAPRRPSTDLKAKNDSQVFKKEWLLTGFEAMKDEYAKKLLAATKAPLEVLQQFSKDLLFSTEQQEFADKVMACNLRWWDIAVNGKLDCYPKWNKPMPLNMALLRVYHCQQASERCAADLATLGAPQMTVAEATDALRYCRWAVASYSVRMGALPAELTEAQLVSRAADVAGVDRSVISFSELDDHQRGQDQLCPRFLVATDVTRREVILAVRGTANLSDNLANLMGDPVPFAGGMAHSGILNAARSLQAHATDALRDAIAKVTLSGQKTRLVLTGHSLGAGAAELLAILLRGAGRDNNDSSGSWVLPDNVDLAVYLYAPPPVYNPDALPERQSKVVDDELDVAERAIAMAVMNCSVGFAMNHDIITRTSLHNGYQLFQQARVVDRHLLLGKREAVKALKDANSVHAEQAQSGRDLIFNAVTSAMCEAAKEAATPSPFATQHAVASRIYHIIGAPGGTAAEVWQDSNPKLRSLTSFVDQRSPTGQPDAPASSLGDSSPRRPRWHACACRASRRRGDSEPTTAANLESEPMTAAKTEPGLSVSNATAANRMDDRANGQWVLKRSDILQEWNGRWRYMWVADGKLCYAKEETGSIAKTTCFLTAASTFITLFGSPSEQAFPSTIVCSGVAPDSVDACADDSDEEPLSLGAHKRVMGGMMGARKSMLVPTPWGLQIQTGKVDGICPAEARTLVLCVNTSAERDAWVNLIVQTVLDARRACYRLSPAVHPSEFGLDATLADGCIEDHGAVRYELALETILEAVRDVA